MFTRWIFIDVVLLEPDQQPLHADVYQHFKDYDEKLIFLREKKMIKTGFILLLDFRSGNLGR